MDRSLSDMILRIQQKEGMQQDKERAEAHQAAKAVEEKLTYWRVEVLCEPWTRDLHTQVVSYTGKNFKRYFIVSEPYKLVSEGMGDDAMKAAEQLAERTGGVRAKCTATSATQIKSLPYEIEAKNFAGLK